MSEQLQHPVFRLLGDLADQHQTDIYVIGGYVRDTLMNRPFNDDVDILVVGNGIAFAEKAGELLGSKVAVYKNFGTAMLRYQDLKSEYRML